METLATRFATNERRKVHFNGKEYLVAPVVLINPGVLDGSEGPLYYPPEECEASVDAWNGMPLVVYHPTDSGTPISARDPETLQAQGVGYVFHTRFDNKLRADAWFDVEALRRVDSRVLDAVKSGRPMEVSTGLFTENELAPEGASFRGKPFKWIARNYKPDHLAILPDETGACSIDDGCGLNVNQARLPRSKESGKWKPIGSGTGKGPVHKAAQKGALVFSDIDHVIGTEAAGTNGMPACIDDMNRWEKAKVKALETGYGGNEYWCAVVHIYRKLGGTFTPMRESDMAMTQNARRRAGLISYLVNNCSCWKGRGDKFTLMMFPTPKLEKLVQQAKAVRNKGAKLKKNEASAETAEFIKWLQAAPPEVQDQIVTGIKEKFLGAPPAPAEAPVDAEEGMTEEEIVAAEEAAMEEEEVAANEGEEEETVANAEDDETVAANAEDEETVANEAMPDDVSEYPATNEGEVVEEEKPVAMKRRTKNRRGVTANAWLSTAPAEIREAVAIAQRIAAREKSHVIAKLTANVSGKAKTTKAKWLAAKSLRELHALASLLPTASRPTINYQGMAGTADGLSAREEVQDILDLPRIDWSKNGQG